MHTHTKNKANASKIKSVIDRIGHASCDIAKDGKSYRVSCNAINSNVFSVVRDMIEAGYKQSTITAQDIANTNKPNQTKQNENYPTQPLRL